MGIQKTGVVYGSCTGLAVGFIGSAGAVDTGFVWLQLINRREKQGHRTNRPSELR